MKLHTLAQIASGLLVIYLLYCGILFVLQRHLLFPRHLIQKTLESPRVSQGLEKIWLATGCGKVEAWLVHPPPGSGEGRTPAVIFAHGNAELIDFWPEEFANLAALGLRVLLVEYPGYGRSEGAPSEESVAEVFVTAYDTLVGRNDVDPSRIVLLGRSLGGGAVCSLAARRPSAALILLSAFASVRSLATRFFVPGFLVRDPFDNLAVVRAYPGPVLVVHGSDDTLIPYSHGIALQQGAQNARMITYACDHNDCPPSWKLFWQDVGAFLQLAGIIQ